LAESDGTLNRSGIGVNLHIMAKRKAAAKKVVSKKAAKKSAVRSRSTASGQYVIFDSPLKPKHVTEKQIRQAVKAAA
jgi:hypothetical protein